MVAREPTEVSTEQFVPDFDDLADGEPSHPSDECRNPEPEPGQQDMAAHVRPCEETASGGPWVTVADPDAGSGSPTPKASAPAQRQPAGSSDPARSQKGRNAGLLTNWRRGVLLGALVLCVATAGVLTGYVVVRSAADWRPTWMDGDHMGGRRPVPAESSGGNTERPTDHPRYPGWNGATSPVPSGSGSPSAATRTARPSRSSAPRTSAPPDTPPSATAPTSPPPLPSPSGSGEPDDN